MLLIKDKRNLRTKTAFIQILFASSWPPLCGKNYRTYCCKVSKQEQIYKYLYSLNPGLLFCLYVKETLFQGSSDNLNVFFKLCCTK